MIYEALKDIRDGYTVRENCPGCGVSQLWSKSNVATVSGIYCVKGCGYKLDLSPGPPTILCSKCGENLYPTGTCFTYFACKRTVRP